MFTRLSLFTRPSLMTRIAIGEAVGFVVGLFGFVFLPFFLPEAGWLMRWGILLWYTTVGAVVGVFGVLTWNPVLKLPWPWWVRAPMIGGWMNFVLTFFAFDVMQAMLVAIFGANGLLSSPFWFVGEGALVGLLIGFFATRFGGEGKETLDVIDDLKNDEALRAKKRARLNHRQSHRHNHHSHHPPCPPSPHNT